MIRRFRHSLSVCLGARIVLSVLALPLVQVHAGPGDTTVPPVIRLTPPAPGVRQRQAPGRTRGSPQTRCRGNRPERAADMLSSEPRVYTNDVDYQFRQENNLYYLTNLNQKRATLVLLTGQCAVCPRFCFCRGECGC